jgi:LacI family transcriptional regulator
VAKQRSPARPRSGGDVAREGVPAAHEATPTPSIYVVAQVAGVSVATVSRVLNGKGPVRATTRAHVLAVVGSMGYVPHSAARSLSTRRTLAIGVVLPDMHGAFFGEIVRGLDLVARAAGYHLLVSGSHSDPAETAAVLQALHGRVDGLVLMAPGLGAGWLRESLPRRVPVVLLNGDDGAPEHSSIRIDNRRGARLAVEHLVALGHRDIAFVAGPPGNSDAGERLRGYEEGVRASGREPQARLELPGDFSEESGARAGAAIAALVPRPTAVFAANDAMAVGCLAALREHGLEVPRDVSLVGFDDIPIARYLTPPLTTVQVPIAELGRYAMDAVLAAVEEGARETSAHAVLAPTLAVRASTARPRRDAPRDRLVPEGSPIATRAKGRRKNS